MLQVISSAILGLLEKELIAAEPEILALVESELTTLVGQLTAFLENKVKPITNANIASAEASNAN